MNFTLRLFWMIPLFILLSLTTSCTTSSKISPNIPDAAWLNNQRLFHQQTIFASGTNGYHTFRIPALTVTQRGTILAFCEGRKGGRGDSGDIDLVLRRSTDGGESWGKLQVVWDQGENTCGNPAPVVDGDTGVIWLLMTYNDGKISESQINKGGGSRDVWATHSDDDGLTWAPPVKINATAKKSNWRWYATGPCHGIQLQSGRLVIPCDHSTGPEFNQWRSHVIYSDDHGKTWRMGGEEPGAFTNESSVVQLADGSLYLNMRSYKGDHRRPFSISHDEGMTWTKAESDPTLIEPRCQGSAIRYTFAPAFKKNRILFSNPASEKRERMTIRISYDEAKTWDVARRIYEGPSAYSDLAVLPDYQVALLYERGEKNPYETITFARMTLSWLTDGQDHLTPLH
ncbi:MAG: exo-alpha-sialidase [Candidatus Omnitrophica bacterium]|nr:exo-alpha-sialidase [Candidatus Omnitrophota bacterium]